MANASTVGFGLRTTMVVGNTPATSGQSEYKIKSGLGVGIFKNNPVSLQDSGGDQGYLQDASFALLTMVEMVEQRMTIQVMLLLLVLSTAVSS